MDIDEIESFPIANLRAGMQRLTVKGIIIGRELIALKSKPPVMNYSFSDPSGTILLTVFDPEIYGQFREGDILLLKNAYTYTFKNQLKLYPKDFIKKIGDFCMVYNDKVNMSEVTLPSLEPLPPLVVKQEKEEEVNNNIKKEVDVMDLPKLYPIPPKNPPIFAQKTAGNIKQNLARKYVTISKPKKIPIEFGKKTSQEKTFKPPIRQKLRPQEFDLRQKIKNKPHSPIKAPETSTSPSTPPVSKRIGSSGQKAHDFYDNDKVEFFKQFLASQKQ